MKQKRTNNNEKKRRNPTVRLIKSNRDENIYTPKTPKSCLVLHEVPVKGEGADARDSSGGGQGLHLMVAQKGSAWFQRREQSVVRANREGLNVALCCGKPSSSSVQLQSMVRTLTREEARATVTHRVDRAHEVTSGEGSSLSWGVATNIELPRGC